ncbi:MAG: hypothetical protein ACREMJ_07485 [Gemmatimonadales bacterium]
MAGALIGREALERIVRRAAELQATERDVGEGLTEQELLALGRDVGIPARYVRQALLEEQTRAAPDRARGLVGWLVGPATVAAQRVVPGDRAEVERALARWLEEQELLQPKRRFPDLTTWESKAGAFASIQRALGGGRRYALAKAREVASQVAQLEPGFCHVRLQADIRNQRGERIAGAAVIALGGAAAAAVTALTGAPRLIPLLPAVAAGGLSVLVTRSHRGPNDRTHVALEQVLDRLERGEIRPEHRLPASRAGAFGRFADELRKTFDWGGP